MIWTTLSVLAVVALGTVVVWLIYQFGRAVGFLQPVLVPFAVAGVLALVGKGQIKKGTPPAPTEAVNSVKADIDTIKEGIHR